MPHPNSRKATVAPKRQVIFFEADEVCERSYADKKGKYQGQQEITLPRL